MAINKPSLGEMPGSGEQYREEKPPEGEKLPDTWSTKSEWLSIGNGVVTGELPDRAEWGEKDDTFWARMGSPISSREAALLTEYVLNAVQLPDGYLKIHEDDKYFAVGIAVS